MYRDYNALRKFYATIGFIAVVCLVIGLAVVLINPDLIINISVKAIECSTK